MRSKLGTKRQCQACGARFYDLGKRPVQCVQCGAEVDLNRLAKNEAPADEPAVAAANPPRKADEPARAAAKPPRAPTQWSPEQSAALDKVGQWLKAGEPQVFRMFGYAGVGKTTLARHIAEAARGEAAFAAFTGKAALVMRSKGCVGASTIHALIYRASEGDEGAPTFKLNHDGPASRAGLIVIDECSMVDEELGRDLISFGKPILVLGDPAQLPPVKGGGYFTEAEPDVMLTEIHRQAENDPIIRLSQIVREGGEIAYGEYGESRVIPRSEIDAAAVLAADQVLVGVNRTRRLYNQRIRELKGLKEALPVAGDKLVCLRNDRVKGLINGGLWRVEALGGMRKDFVRLTVRSEDETGRGQAKVAVLKQFFEGAEADLPYPVRRESDEFDYGYALTVHKAQGSQWDRVMLFDESRAFREHRARWLYTGLTRAARQLTIVR
ncbi:MAG: FYDLN acid domain-containing protein [Hyphomicrobiales bacterium]|nr:FYDLN acid domain-containing protein [Hyphomicrobiales bacterium]MBV8662554.1 FYDLN acid domain-containing protein [Hyphomicrobiales bacterium]